jgi:hypothetical protein
LEKPFLTRQLMQNPQIEVIETQATETEENTPKVLFKYRPLSTHDDLARVLDIIINQRLYLPTVAQLNDPFEGCSIIINGTWAGCSIPITIGELQPPMKEALGKYRVLSLAGRYDSPQMWAHYANGFKGVCLAISTSSLPYSCEKVEYNNEIKHEAGSRLETKECALKDSCELIARKSLLRKMESWFYENEWRVIVHKDELDKPFLNLGEKAFPFIILGQNMQNNFRELISDICQEKHIPVFRTHQMPQECCVLPLPNDMQLRYDGENIHKQIRDYEQAHNLKSIERLMEMN